MFTMPDVETAKKLSHKHPPHTSKNFPTHVSTDYIIKQLKKTVSEKKLPVGLFLIAPPHESFEIQEPQEKIILFLRPHWFTTLRWFFITLILLILPAIIKPLPPPFFFTWGARFIDAATILWYLFVLTYFLRSFLSWYYDVYFVTDERVISIDFKNMMAKRVSDTKIDRIQDISFSQRGFFQSTLDYGDVLIQTAAEQNLFVFKNVPKPKYITEVLQTLIAQEEAEFYHGVTRDLDKEDHDRD